VADRVGRALGTQDVSFALEGVSDGGPTYMSALFAVGEITNSEDFFRSAQFPQQGGWLEVMRRLAEYVEDRGDPLKDYFLADPIES
jgi:hypothetical protein